MAVATRKMIIRHVITTRMEATKRSTRTTLGPVIIVVLILGSVVPRARPLGVLP
jgi:hypothetical protein